MDTKFFVHIFETLFYKSEPYISFTEILDRTSIMDKNRKNFRGILHGFYKSCIVMGSEILTEDEEGTIMFFHEFYVFLRHFSEQYTTDSQMFFHFFLIEKGL